MACQADNIRDITKNIGCMTFNDFDVLMINLDKAGLMIEKMEKIVKEYERLSSRNLFTYLCIANAPKKYSSTALNGVLSGPIKENSPLHINDEESVKKSLVSLGLQLRDNLKKKTKTTIATSQSKKFNNHNQNDGINKKTNYTQQYFFFLFFFFFLKIK